MSDKNLKSRKSSQPRKISIERVLKLMVLIQGGKASPEVLKQFRDDLKKSNPKIKESAVFEIFQRQFGILERKLKPKVQAIADKALPTPQEVEEIKKSLEEANNTPPPLPQNPLKGLSPEEMMILLERKDLELKEAMKGIEQVSNMALEFKAEAMVERQENQLLVKTMNELIPAKIAEAMNITVERVEQGRELRRKQVLHALHKNENARDNVQN